MAHSTPPPPDLTDALLAILERHVSPPTAQSILKLARQRAGVSTPRLDRPQLGEMFAAIEGNLRLFVSEPSKIDDCCSAIQELIGARSSTPEPRSTPTMPPASGRLSEPSSIRAVPPASVRQPAPSSVRAGPPSTRSPPSSRSPPPPSSSLRQPSSTRSPSASVVILIRGEDDVVRARNLARELASSLGFVSARRTRLVTAVSELARNIVLHATHGQIELTSVPSAAGMAIVATDHGPGIANLEQILLGEIEGRSSAGIGLREMKRLADRFEIQTAPGQGTTVSLFVKVT